MIHITPEKKKERYEALPIHLREYMTSLEISELIAEIAASQHLTDEKARQASMAIGAVFLGFLQPEHLAKEIEERTGLKKDHAEHIAEAIQRKIIAPILPDLQRLYGWGIAGALQPAPPREPASQGEVEETAPAVPPPIEAPPPPPPPKPGSQPETVPPIVRRPEPEGTESKSSPYLLHQQKEVVERVSKPAGENTLMRPYFFEPAAGTKKEEAPTEARLEFGGFNESEGEGGEPVVGKAGEQKPRIVNYSTPKTDLDPFGRVGIGGDDKGSKDVPPDNIVDLKKPPT